MQELRNDFPFFAMAKTPLIYFDNAATTQKPGVVIDAISNFYAYHAANPGRGLYDLSEQASRRQEEARQAVARFINAQDASEIIFTPGATYGINAIAQSWGRTHIGVGDEIVITRVEHHANFLPWIDLAQKQGALVRYIELDPETFQVQYDHSIITPRTKFVAVTHVSNVLGSVWGEEDVQLKKLISDARAVGAKVLIDGAQSVPHRLVNIQELKPDFLVFSGHKMLGPTGIGVLYINRALHEAMEPYLLGGGMVEYANYQKAKWLPAPHRFEAGTPPIAQIVGLHAAISYLEEHGLTSKMKQHHQNLCRRLLDQLITVPGIKIWGNSTILRQRGHIISFAVDGLHAHDLAAYLGHHAIAVRAGHHCAQPLASYLGITATVRVSFYVYNTLEEVDQFVIVLRNAIAVLQR